MTKRKKIDIIDLLITFLIIIIITVLGLLTYYKFYYQKEEEGNKTEEKEEKQQGEFKIIEEVYAQMRDLNNYSLDFKVEEYRSIISFLFNYYTYDKAYGLATEEAEETLEMPFYLIKDHEDFLWLYYYDSADEEWKKEILEEYQKDTLFLGQGIISNLKNIKKDIDIQGEKEIDSKVIRLTGTINEKGFRKIIATEEVEVNQGDQIKFIMDINQTNKYIINLAFKINDLIKVSIKFNKIKQVEDFEIPEGVLSATTENDEDNLEESGIKSISFTEYLSLLDNPEKNLIYIGSNECPHCEKVEPIYQQIALDYNLIFYYLNLDDLKNEERQSFYQTNEIFNKEWGTPLLMVYKNKSLIDYYMGEGDYETISDFIISR